MEKRRMWQFLHGFLKIVLVSQKVDIFQFLMKNNIFFLKICILNIFNLVKVEKSMWFNQKYASNLLKMRFYWQFWGKSINSTNPEKSPLFFQESKKPRRKPYFHNLRFFYKISKSVFFTKNTNLWSFFEKENLWK